MILSCHLCCDNANYGVSMTIYGVPHLWSTVDALRRYPSGSLLQARHLGVRGQVRLSHDVPVGRCGRCAPLAPSYGLLAIVWGYGHGLGLGLALSLLPLPVSLGQAASVPLLPRLLRITSQSQQVQTYASRS